MNTISVRYDLKWQVKETPEYQVTPCGKMFNVKTGRQIKLTLNNRCAGFWIKGKFVSLSKIRSSLIKIQTIKTPF
jgi:hypothetical protein